MTVPSMLVVDDDEVLRERLARALRERGWQVATAGGYDTALAAATSSPPACALIDLKMPGRSGLDLLRGLKSLLPSTKVVVLTGYGSIATALEAMRLGAHHYLPKPADADEIVAAFSRDPEAPHAEPDAAVKAPTLARAEWEHISRVLADTGNNISEAARRLGMPRRTLQLKLKKLPPRE